MKSKVELKRVEYKVGQPIPICGKIARVVRVWPLGTVDVEIDGAFYRVTGLPIYE